MKRRGLMLVTVVCACVSFFMWFGVSNLLAAQGLKRVTQDSAAMQAQMAAKIKQALTAKEWTVYVVKVDATRDRPAVVEPDVLTFTDRTVTSKNLIAGGYSKTGSNYALRVGMDGLSVWETMQMHENEKDIVFLRGELPKDCDYMTGSMIYQSPKGTERTENFSTSMPASPAPVVTTTTSAITAPAAAVTTGTAQGAPAGVTTTSAGTTRTTTSTRSRR